MKKGGKRLRQFPQVHRRRALCSRILAWGLVLALTAPLCGTVFVYAEDPKEGVLCPHHEAHTEDCGYLAPDEGAPCGHVHDESCGYLAPVEGASCGHVHDESCGYLAPAEGVPCGHIHDETCGYREAADEIPCDLDCQETDENGETIHQEGCAYTPAVEETPCGHEHDEACGYAAPSEGVPCGHVHDGACGYAEAAEGVPCGHVHDEACGYAEPAGGAPCTFLCGLCVTSWQWADEEETLVQSEETGVWGLGVPGASQETPVTREMLEELLPKAVIAETAADSYKVELAWDLSAFPEAAFEGVYSAAASLTGDYLLAGNAPALEVLVDLGGGETYALTAWAFNKWTWEGYDLQGDATVGVCIDGINSPAELKRALEQRLPQRIYAQVWGNIKTSPYFAYESATPGTGINRGWLTVFWNDLSSQLSQITDWRNDFTLYATPPSDNTYDYIVNDNSTPEQRMLRLPITISPFSLEGHTVTAATPLATTVNLFDYWVQTDGSKGNDILTKSDYHVNSINRPVERTTVADWSNGINKGRLLLFGDGNIHAGFWNKGAGAISDYGKTYAGMEGIVKPVLENGYPTINTEAMASQIHGYSGITDWKLCGDELSTGPGTAESGAVHDSTDPKQNLSTTVINQWKASGNSASLDYLFNPDISNSYKRSYEDVKGLFQLDSQGYYYYDMRRNFAEFDGRDQFILYDAPAVDRTDNSYENGGFTGGRSTGNFFPFNKGSQVFTGIEDGKLVNDETIQSHNSKNKGGTPMNHHLGMTLTVDFRQPVDGLINMGAAGDGTMQKEPMSFQFSGDDDVWIFVDDVLVLDLGGIHSEIFGTIDFATGKVKIGQSWKTNGFPYMEDPLNPGEEILDLAALEGSSIQTTTLRALFAAAGKENDFSWRGDTFASDTDHTLKMFYLERGNYDSSLAVRFNLQPQLYQQIKKVDQNGEALEGVEFQLFPAEETSDSAAIECLYTDSDVHSGNTFYVQQQPGSSALATLVTDENGESLFVREVSDRTGEKKTEPFNFADRNEDYYILRETKTPDGYRAQPIDIVLRYDKDTSMLTVANRWTTGAYACSVSNITGLGRLTYGHFDAGNSSITPNYQKPVAEERQSGGLVIAVPMLQQKDSGDWEALYGSNLGGFKAVKITKQSDADSWRWAVLEAALRQSMDEEAPEWYFDWDEGNKRLVGTLSGLPGLASRYQVNDPKGDMRMVYGIVEPAALAVLGINISEPAGDKTAAQLRYEALAAYAQTHTVEETIQTIKKVTISDNGSGTGFSFLNTNQFNRNFRSLIYIPNEQRELWVQKIDQDGKPVLGTEFGLFTDAACSGTPAARGFTDSDGLLVFSPRNDSGAGHAQIVWAGSTRTRYYLKEISAPAGYVVNTTVTPVVVGTYSIYADAGVPENGVRVMAGVGRLTQTMRQYAMGNDVDITLQDITAFGQYQSSSNASVPPDSWKDRELNTTVKMEPPIKRFMNLHFNKNALVDYGLHDQDGGLLFKPFFVTDEGFIRARVQQKYDTSEYTGESAATAGINKDDLKETDLTNLFSLLNVVVVTNQTSPDTKTGELTISKWVEGTGLTAADYTKNFTFVLSLKDPAGNPLPGSYYFYGPDKAGYVKDGDEIPLHHDETITILGLPEGTRFEVKETQEKGWFVFPESGVIGGTIVNDKTSAANFRNSKQEWTIGELTIVKIVKEGGDREKDFTFIVTLTDESGTPLTGTFPAVKGKEEIRISNGSKVTLRHNQSITIKELPAGTKYKVEETPDESYQTSSTGAEGSIVKGEISTAEFTNTLMGTLTIRKTVTGAGDTSKPFTFTVTLTDSSGTALPGTFPYTKGEEKGRIASGGTVTLSHGQSAVISGLPAGTRYTVKEEEANQGDYKTTPSSGSASGQISDQGGAVAAFTNSITPSNPSNPSPKPGSLTIKKTVAGDGDKTREFTFTVVLKDKRGEELKGEFRYTTGAAGEGTFTSGGAITLRHGDQITIEGLPDGATFTVTETATPGWKVTPQSGTVNGTVYAGGVSSASFTNEELPEDPTTGSVTIQKTVAGEGDREQDFTFIVSLEKEDGTPLTGSFPYTGSKEGFISDGGSITLRHGQSVTITGLPDGARYIVTEREADQDGYTTSASGDGGTISGGSGATASFTNTKTPPPPPPEEPQLPDPNDPQSPPTITIEEDGVPRTYVRIWDPEKEEWVYVPEDEIPLGNMEIPDTGDAWGFWQFSSILSLLGLAALRFRKKKDTENDLSK